MIDYLKITLLSVMFLLVMAAAFLWTSLVPDLGEYTRILYFHVPVAWLAVLAFLLSAIASFLFLKKRQLKYDSFIEASNQLGFIFCLLATISGSIWAKMSWGSFWNWDPRETSIFVLLLIYAAYFALRSALETPERKAMLSAVYSLFAFITVPFLVFIIPRVYFSLHPDPIVNTRSKIDLDGMMLLTFSASLITFTLLFLWILNMKITLERMKREVHILAKSILQGKD